MTLKAVRRVNEWDGPSMLKVYTPYTGTPQAPENEPPELQDYIQRIEIGRASCRERVLVTV